MVSTKRKGKETEEKEDVLETKDPTFVRPELNIEKWPAIWSPTYSRVKPEKKIIERAITLENGDKVTGIVNVGFTDKGVLTTEDQKVWYVMVLLWETMGRGRRIYFSRNKVIKLLQKKWGNNSAKSLDQSLFRLRFTPITWTNAFYDRTTNKTSEKVETLTFLSDYKTVTEKESGHITKELCYCEFHELIYKNLINNHVKPTLFDTVIGFDDGIAQILYTHLDLILSEIRENEVYKRRSKGLFDDLHWTGKEYKYVSARKRTLERIIPKLKNKRISKGGFLQLNLEETVDKQDYNLVTWRSLDIDSNFISSKVKDGNNKLFNTTSLLLAEGVSREIGEDKLKQEANELVQYFHKRFFKLSKIEPQENELNQALKIIKKYGFEVAKFVVEYAFKKAPETNFKIAVFGGILQYVSKAVANWEIEQASIEKASESQNKAKFIANCSICKNTYGEVYWMKIGDEHNIINVMNCLHNENQHKDLENQHKIKITNSRDDLKILFINK